VERLYRSTDVPHKELTKKIGPDRLIHYYNYADAYHCENPDKIIGELAEELNLPEPPLFHELPEERKNPPFSKMAKSAARVINEVYGNDHVKGVYDYYTSFLPPLLADTKNNLYWSSKEYLVAC
jgi:hypothetical protein